MRSICRSQSLIALYSVAAEDHGLVSVVGESLSEQHILMDATAGGTIGSRCFSVVSST